MKGELQNCPDCRQIRCICPKGIGALTTSTNKCEKHYGCDFAVDSSATKCVNPHCERENCHTNKEIVGVKLEAMLDSLPHTNKCEHTDKEQDCDYHGCPNNRYTNTNSEWEKIAAQTALKAHKEIKHYAKFSEVISQGIEQAVRGERNRILAALQKFTWPSMLEKNGNDGVLYATKGFKEIITQ